MDLLTCQEEVALSKRIIHGKSKDGKFNKDAIKARDELVCRNFGLVAAIVHDDYIVRVRNKMPYDDLLQEGYAGLIVAAEHFDHRFNVNFSTYARFWIKASITRAIVNTAGHVRIPYYLYKYLRKYFRLQAKYPRMYEDDIIKMIDLPPKSIKNFHKTLRLYKANAVNFNLNEYHNTYPPLTDFEDSDNIEFVNNAVEKLPKNQQKVVIGRFGLDRDEPKTLRTMEEEMGVSRETVRLWEKKAFDNLKPYLQQS